MEAHQLQSKLIAGAADRQLLQFVNWLQAVEERFKTDKHEMIIYLKWLQAVGDRVIYKYMKLLESI